MNLHILIKHISSEIILRAIYLTLSVYLIVLLAVIVDLYSGLRRSKRLGISLKSKGIRSSMRKFNDYIVLILLATFADMLLCSFGVYNLPYLTLAFGIIAIANEIRSVWENTDRSRQKEISQALQALSQLARSPKEASEIIQELQKTLDTNEHKQ